jgi:thiol:disulfide interchange protein DsbC
VKIKSIVINIFLMAVVASGAYLVGNRGLPDAFAKASDETLRAADKPGSVEGGSLATQDTDAKVKAAILSSVQRLDPSVQDIQIEASPLTDIYWVLLPGNEAILISADGQYYLGKGMAVIADKKLEAVNSKVLERVKASAQKEVVHAFKESVDQQLVYEAKGEKKGEVYVFTDVNCGYCRKFHKDVPQLTESGIAVHYFAGPFFSKDRAILEKIWCANDPLTAMTKVKTGLTLSGVEVSEDCQSIVSSHIALGQKLGIRGTPALFTKEGEQLGGYVPPQQLIQRLTGS